MQVEVRVQAGHPVHISEAAARIIISFLDSVPAAGSAAKYQLGYAQAELEKGLAATYPPASAQDDEAGEDETG